MSTYYFYDRNEVQVKGRNEKCDLSLFHYCPSCNVAIAGKWTYYDRAFYYTTNECLEEELHGRKSLKTDSHSELNYWRRSLNDWGRSKKLFPISEFLRYGTIHTTERLKDFCYSYDITDIHVGEYTGELCKEFNSDQYAELLECYSNLTDTIKQFRDEIVLFEKMEKCPCCGGDFCNVPYIYTDTPATIINEAICTIEDQIVKNLSIEAEEKVKKFDALDKRQANILKKTVNNAEELKTYLYHIISLEKIVFSVRKRLSSLYAKLPIVSSDTLVQNRLRFFHSSNKLMQLQKQREILKEKKPEELIEKEKVELIPYPLEPAVPHQPVLLTPGFFNKKKVYQQNEKLKADYNAQMTEYAEAHKRYLQQVEEVNKQNQSLRDKQEQVYLARVEKAKQDHLQEVCEIDAQILAIENEISSYDNKEENAKPDQVVMIEKEIAESEELLKNTYNALNEMYGCGIIFEKYRNFVSVSTFYEYISSGRCYTLAGSEGAYNLYENEIRANILISQMSQIITSLEEIKNSQYIIYSAISEVNAQLQSLNSAMDQAVESLASIEKDTSNASDKLEKIAENSSIIAYNTERTAFYAEKNAELTNALGYLVALS